MRKRIGLLTIGPEEDYQQRLLEGVFSQCEKYDYDVCVVTPMVKVTNFFKEYLEGELNIYELINFELFDGIIVTPLPMTQDRIEDVVVKLNDKLKKECKCPVICADLALKDYPVIETDDSAGFSTLVRHLINEHNCKDFAMLTGMKDYDISENRLEYVKKELEANGLSLSDNRIYYGDFWYSGGEKLAEELAEDRENLPDAVICASDTMAVGLSNRLSALGINVPNDIVVTGYDGGQEAAIGKISITTYATDQQKTGALCVNYLRSMIDPNKEILSVDDKNEENLIIGESCGCNDDRSYFRKRFASSLYFLNHNFDNTAIWNGIDIGLLMESYTSEILTATGSPLQCLEKIYESTYLLKPYGWFYLCLSENWLEPEKDIKVGYPEKMHLVLAADMLRRTHGYINHVFFGKDRTKAFDTKDMLPALNEEFDKPQVFYFVPVHFNSICLGYAVLQNDLDQKELIGITFRNYIRNINNSLEMSRMKNRISEMSEKDMMTGLYNRRGLERMVSEELSLHGDAKQFMTFVIDMDNLKFINDNYGHTVGDRGICMISEAIAKTSGRDGILVRAGGDEFYVINIGEFTNDQMEGFIEEFRNNLSELNEKEALPVKVDASVGGSITEIDAGVYAALDEADVRMYCDKRKRKSQR